MDVLSPELVAELEKLQDDVPSFDPQEAVAIVEREIGGPISSRYEEFDPNPIAAASLGQVSSIVLYFILYLYTEARKTRPWSVWSGCND